MLRKRVTYDRLDTPALPASTIMTHERIGLKRHLTPEGFLLCEGVPVARTGWMMYGAREVPITPKADSPYTMIHRGPEDLFTPRAISSFVGKPVTNDHPMEGVNPANWARVAVGTAHNLRRGAADDSDVLLADLLITDAKAIADIKSGKVEVSAGYDADYMTVAPGEGRQMNIVGNHIALVARGRCGPRCAIGDTALTTTINKETNMPTAIKGKQRRVISDAVRQMALDAGLEAMQRAMSADEQGDEGDDDNNVHIHVHTGDDAEAVTPPTAKAKTIDARMSALETGMQTLTGLITTLVTKDSGTDDSTTNENDDTGEEKPKKPKAKTDDEAAGDSKALETSYTALVADAEVVVPGMNVPAFNATASRKVTVDSMCAIRRKALDINLATTEGKKTVDAIAGAATLDLLTMDCAEVATLFKSVAGAKRLLNNSTSVRDAHFLPQGNVVVPKKTGPQTIAEINEANKKFYGPAATP